MDCAIFLRGSMCLVKTVHAVPIRIQQLPDVLRGLIEVLDKIGILEQFFVDNEGACSGTEVIRLLNKHKVKAIITTSLPPFVERVIQT